MNNKIRLLFVALLLALASCQKENDDVIDPKPDPKPIPIEDSISYPRSEMRAVWIATVDRIDWPKVSSANLQKQEFTSLLDLLKKHNINTVIMQIRPAADAFYKSDLEPWSSYITGELGKDPGYDVLQFMIDETHKRGLEFHAWFNPYRISNNAPAFVPAEGSLAKLHPEWTMTYNKLLLFRPAVPEVQAHFVSVVEDVLSKYDVDGVHLDDYFYPYPAEGFTLNDQSDYIKYGNGYTSIEDFRRANVDKVIEGVHNLLVAKHPGVLFSVSPFSDYSYNRDILFADIRLWCTKKWIDCVMPQLYAGTKSSYANFNTQVDWWTAFSAGVPVLAGHALYKFNSTTVEDDAAFRTVQELVDEMDKVRSTPAIKGSAWYNASAFRDNKIRVLNTLDTYYNTPALVPFFARKTVADPAAVTNLRVADGGLVWDASGEGLHYAVYQLQKSGSVTNNIQKLNATLVAVTDQKSYIPEASGDYVVTTINRDNTEGKASVIISFNK